jgi:hypothetical protein
MGMSGRSGERKVMRSSSSGGRHVSARRKRRRSKVTGTGSRSGLTCCALSTTWHQNGLSWSSPQETRIGKPRCHVIWQKLASTRPELSSRLAMLVRLIYAGECSFLPAPVSRDWRSPGLRSHGRLRGSRGQPLPEVIGSRVHPEVLEWLMGLPSGWTATLPYRPSGTATHRR